MDAYAGDMDAYVRDKRTLVEGQSALHVAVLDKDDPVQTEFPPHTHARILYYSTRDPGANAYLTGTTGTIRGQDGSQIVLDGAAWPRGTHLARNLLAAALALHALGLEGHAVQEALRCFPGLEHRLEMFLELEGLRVWNDSASTVPEATLAAVQSMDRPCLLICGGNDKGLEYTPFRRLAAIPRRTYVLAGTAAAGVLGALRAGDGDAAGPYASLRAAIEAALSHHRAGEDLLFSPGCTSFGMFLNEFDRGRTFKEMMRSLVGARA
jgi:UDP-N-acetylmuramoylalanine--D-glutamate ligase